MRSIHPWPVFPPHLEPPAMRSLSILFILQEWLSVVQNLDAFQHNSSDPSLLFLLEKGEKSLLFSVENPFPKKGGSLDKICFYSEMLLQASKINDHAIYVRIEEMRTSILLFKRKLLSTKKNLPSLLEIEQETTQFAKNLLEQCRHFFFQFTPFLQEARTDENVLIYLLENKKTFNHYLGERFLEEMLQKFFPTGPSHLRAVICEGFTRRSFTSFLTEKERLLEELEWEIPCQM